MSRDLEHLLNMTAVEPSRPIDPTELARLARKRRRLRHAGSAIAGVAAVAGLVTVVTVPSTGADDAVTTPPADSGEPDVPPLPFEQPMAPTKPYRPGFDCPVTTPPTPGFTPPAGYPATPNGDGRVWYGTEQLWTVLPVGGEYVQRKSVWWSVNFDISAREYEPEIEVVWERLDADVAPHTNGGLGTNANTSEDGWFVIAGIDPPEPGCWQVTAKYKGAELTYVYEVPGQAVGDESEPVKTAEPDATGNRTHRTAAWSSNPLIRLSRTRS